MKFKSADKPVVSDISPQDVMPEIDRETRLKLFRTQLELRYFETRASDLFLQNLVKGTNHLGLGQEAIAAGFGVAMHPGDMTFCTYRGHLHTLVRGPSMKSLFGELMGRACGVTGGKGGSMHLTSVEHGAMGSYAIIGAQLCVANGTAWSSQYRGTDEVTTVFFGDGTTNIGAFHEALNFAVIWNLPVVFVCENNLYMEYTPIDKVTAVEHPAADRASAYGLDSVIVDGNDIDAVYHLAQSVYERARAGGGPSLIEAKTYRHQGHSRADPGKYRPAEELAAWMERDPVKMYRARLLDLGFDEAELTAIEAESQEKVDDATEAAKASPIPDEELIFKDVWADGGAEWRN
jgi:TPP-dependent pyruvate/acetoin dehydrogenase alpha subunit